MKDIRQQQHVTETAPYMGIDVIKSWNSSNFIGTVQHSAVLPDGRRISSPNRKSVTKRIKKYFTQQTPAV